MNGILKNRIVKICQHTGLNWIAALPLALMVCCSSELRGLHMTSHELLTGRQMPLLHKMDTGEDNEEVVIEGELMERCLF